jgi:ATP adenylyltransferase
MQFIPTAELLAAMPPGVAPGATPAAAMGWDVPLDTAVAAYRAASGWASTPGKPFTLPALASLPHAMCLLGGDITTLSSTDAATRLHGYYVQLLDQVAPAAARAALAGSAAAAGAAAGSASSHNVVLTERWMLVVPRVRAECDGISINGLGFAGLMLASPEQAELLLQRGPLAVLRACAPASEPDV